MAVFRIEKTRDYTVMSNYHLRNAGLSLKSKGLLSMMLSLPEDWNYTTRGLAKICKGKIVDVEYVIYETPHPPDTGQPCEDEPDTACPDTENPDMDNPTRNGKRLTLEDECLQSCSLPSIAYGFKRCSLKHKIGPQEKFCNHCRR